MASRLERKNENCLFIVDTIFYVENLVDSIKKLIELMNLCKVAEYKKNIPQKINCIITYKQQTKNF